MRRLGIGALVLVSAVVYVNTLTAGFTLDDIAHIVENQRIRHLEEILTIFRSSTWPGTVYRPLVIATFTLTHAAVGLSPWAYHLTNLLIHAAVVVLAFLVVTRLFGSAVGFLAALIFAVHPLHVEAVANIANRNELMAALLGLACLAVVLRQDSRAKPRRLQWAVAIASLFFLALLAKESAMCVALLVPLCLCRSDGLAPGTRRFVVLLPFIALAALAYVALRSRILGAMLAEGHPHTFLENPLLTLGLAERLPNALALLTRYLALGFFPRPLRPEYSYAQLLPASLDDPHLVLELMVLASLVGTSLWLVWRHRTLSPLPFWIAWFLLAFAFTSNIVLPIPTIFAERLAYLPSLAVCGLLAHGLLALRRGVGRTVVISALILWFSVETATNNAYWHDNATLFARAVVVAPDSAKTHSWYGEALRDQGRLDEASAQYQWALRIYPELPPALHGLATVDLRSGRNEQAKQLLERAIASDPKFVPSLNVLGRILVSEGRVDDGARLFVRALNADNDNLGSMLGILLATMRKGNRERAELLRAELMQRDPGNAELAELSRELDAMPRQTARPS